MKIGEVFGVSKDPVASYFDRKKVEESLANALASTRQIIIYGSSKQGKTSLLSRHLPPEKRVTVHCGPGDNTINIYKSFLRQLDAKFEEITTTTTSSAKSSSVGATIRAFIPGLSSSATGNHSENTSESDQTSFRTLDFNLDSAQDFSEVLRTLDISGKYFVLENFHYLDDEVQAKLAHDIRTFEELGIRIIILGVWRESNRLSQYNGDLQDRISEVPVEPWLPEDFEEVITLGERALNVKICSTIKDRIISNAHGSIAVVQELAKSFCILSSIEETSEDEKVLSDKSILARSIEDKAADYYARHTRSLESIAAGSRTRSSTEMTNALYLPYHFVLTILESSSDDLHSGIERKVLQERISKDHPSPESVRSSDITGFLQRLASLQEKQRITPPLFDFDRKSRRVKVVDSTLFFFIDNSDLDEIRSEIPAPDEYSN